MENRKIGNLEKRNMAKPQTPTETMDKITRQIREQRAREFLEEAKTYPTKKAAYAERALETKDISQFFFDLYTAGNPRLTESSKNVVRELWRDVRLAVSGQKEAAIFNQLVTLHRLRLPQG